MPGRRQDQGRPLRQAQGRPQFLVVGHVVQDLMPPDGPLEGDSSPGRAGWRLGGTAAYASQLARSLGLATAVLTAASPDLPLEELLPGIDCRAVPSPATTHIRNVYTEGHRQQHIPQRGAPLTPSHLPEEWRKSNIVLLGPVAGEVDAALAGCFPRSLLGVGAQGWLRQIGPDGRVRPLPPQRWEAAPILSSARALFVSDEDVPPHEVAAALQEWSLLVDIVAFTRGDLGAEVCHRGDWRHIDPFPAHTVDPTGAGDIFAAGFLIRLWETKDVWEATRFAVCAASFVIEGEGTTAIPSRGQVEARLRQHPEILPD